MKLHINIKQRLIGILTIIILLVFADFVEAQYGGARRRTRRRTAVIVSTATHEKDQQEEAAEQQEKEAAPQEEKTAQQDSAPQSESAKADHLPIGTVVTKLPDGCESTPINDVEYYLCGNDYYRAAYQENNLVYVTTEPPK